MRSINVHGHPGYTLWLGDNANVGVKGEFGVVVDGRLVGLEILSKD